MKASTYEVMWKPAVEVEFCREGRTQCRKPGAQVGVSWFIEQRDGLRVISHSGGDDGFLTDLVLVPDADMGLVLMTNALAAGTTLPRKIVQEFLKLAAAPPGAPR